MDSESQFDRELARKPHAYLEFGGPGHETEYVFKIQPGRYMGAVDAPPHWERELQSSLGDAWSVMDRGGRIEITPPNSKRTEETDIQLREAIGSLIGEEYEFPETR